MSPNNTLGKIGREEVLEFARIIGACPTAGEGVHRWIFSAALKLKHCCDEATAREVIALAGSCCGRAVPEREISDAVRNARTSEPKRALPQWPRKNPALIATISTGGATAAVLKKKSPVNG